MIAQYALNQIKERDIRFIRLWFTDILGNLKSFAITPSDMDIAFEEGISFDGSFIEGVASVQESNMVLHPDPSTFQVLPWRPSNNGVARMFCDLYTPEGEPLSGDSRRILMNVVKKAADMGFSASIDTDLEYFYFKDASAPNPIDAGGYFDLTPLDNAVELRRDAVLTLEQMGVPVEYSHHEAAPSQHEIDLRASDPLTAADSVMTARLVVREVACAQGVHASFMPKPIEDVAGSGMHVHLALFDEGGEDVFYDANDPDGYELSQTAKRFMAGVLRYAPEFSLITNQYVNSYKRFVDQGGASSCVSWSRGNRSTLLRVPRRHGGKDACVRVEMLCADSTANPYLAFAAMLAAGLKGIEEELELMPPAQENLFALSIAERAERGFQSLPTDLSRAADVFEDSDLMRSILGESVHAHLLANKRAEWEAFRKHVSAWDIQRYLAKL